MVMPVPAYGYLRTAEGRTEPDASEQSAIRTILAAARSGKSCAETARILSALGRRPRGRRWYAQTVHRIRARYRFGKGP